jgi:hypothetical protein
MSFIEYPAVRSSRNDRSSSVNDNRKSFVIVKSNGVIFIGNTNFAGEVTHPSPGTGLSM